LQSVGFDHEVALTVNLFRDKSGNAVPSQDIPDTAEAMAWRHIQRLNAAKHDD